MTPEEAIKTIKVAIAEVEWDYPMNYSVAFETAIEALEKQIPKKPKNSDRMVCPVCNSKANYGHPYTDYCCHCGQKTDWRETE